MIESLRERLHQLRKDERCRTDIKQFVEFGLGYFVVLVLGYFLLRKINLTLSVSEMGVFSYVSSWVTILAPVLCLAAPQAYLRFHDNHSVGTRLKRFLFPFYAFASVALAVFVYLKTHSWFAIFYAVNPFFLERTYLLRSQMQIRSLNVLRTCELLVPLAGLYVLLPRTNVDASVVLGLYGLGYAITWLFPARRGSDSALDKKVVLRFLWPLVFTTLLMTLMNNVAVLLAKHFLGYEAAGQMGVAVRALLFLRSMTSVFLMFYPMIYFREAKRGNFGVINLYRMVMLSVVGIAAVVFVVFAPLLYRIIGAGEYVETVNVFRILLAIEVLNFMFDVFCSYFAFEIKTWKSTLFKAAGLLSLGVLLPMNIGHGSLTGIANLILVAVFVSSASGIYYSLMCERKER